MHPLDRYRSPKGRSPEVLAAYNALTGLRRADGSFDLDSAMAVYAAAMREPMLAAFKATYHLVPAAGITCARRVAGVRCRHYVGDECLPPFTDHASLWRVADSNPSRYVFVSQPYSLSEVERSELSTWAFARGLSVSIRALGSWHYAGWTLLVAFYRAGGGSTEVRDDYR